MPQIDVSVTTPDAATLSRQTKMLVYSADSIAILSLGDYEEAGEELREVKKKHKELDTLRKSITKPMDEAKGGVMALFRAPLDFLEKAENILKGKMIAYANEQKKIQAAEEARARKAQRIEQERLEKEAMEAAKQGDIEQAAMLEAEAEMVPVSAAVAPIPTATGTSARQTWTAEVYDVDALMRAVLAGDVTPEVFLLNRPMLNGWARSMKTELKVPGVRAKPVDGLAARS